MLNLKELLEKILSTKNFTHTAAPLNFSTLNLTLTINYSFIFLSSELLILNGVYSSRKCIIFSTVTLV